MLVFGIGYCAINQDKKIIHTQENDTSETASLRPVIWVEQSQG